MNRTSRRTLALFIFIFLAQMLLGCDYVAATLLPPSTPSAAAPEGIEAPYPDYADAQATIDAGNSQLIDLSRQGAEVDREMAQTQDASALSNQDANQRKKNELDLQATGIGLNIAHAAATQEFIAQQTQIAVDATTRAQNRADAATQAADQVMATQAAQAQAIQDIFALQTVQANATQTAYPLTATYSAQLQNATETVQAQALLFAQATQADQAQMTGTAYPLTATPLAVTQAALLMQQYKREQQSFKDQVVTPLIPILVIMILHLAHVWDCLGLSLVCSADMASPPVSWPSKLSPEPHDRDRCCNCDPGSSS